MIEDNKDFKPYEHDKTLKSKQTTLLLYRVKDESGESLVFQLKLTKSGKDVLKFGMEQVIQLISVDVSQEKVTFFIVGENFVPKEGEKLDRSIFNKCLKVFIKDASVDSLKQMISHMNEYHRKMQEVKKNKENQQKNASVPEIVNKPVKSVRNIDLSEDLQKINRKRKMRALMNANPKVLAKHLLAQRNKKVEQQEGKENEEEKVHLC
jgi:leucyl aminopeptidase